MLVVFGAMVVTVLVLAIPVVISMLRVARRHSRNRSVPHRDAEARVVDKRSQVTGGGQSPAEQLYFVTFQFPDGNRRELRVPASESGLLVVGDEGRLTWRGTDYLGFDREILR